MDQGKSIRAFNHSKKKPFNIPLQLKIRERPPNQAFYLRDGVLWVHHGRSSNGCPNKQLLVTKAYNSWSLRLGLIVEDYIDSPLPRHSNNTTLIPKIKSGSLREGGSFCPLPIPRALRAASG
ncbi:hypothetical protein Droror1_Dr00026801 [Drosera rotundifolia]